MLFIANTIVLNKNDWKNKSRPQNTIKSKCLLSTKHYICKFISGATTFDLHNFNSFVNLLTRFITCFLNCLLIIIPPTDNKMPRALAKSLTKYGWSWKMNMAKVINPTNTLRKENVMQVVTFSLLSLSLGCLIKMEMLSVVNEPIATKAKTPMIIRSILPQWA